MSISKKNRMKNQNISYNTRRNMTRNNVTLAVLRDLKNRLEKLNMKISVLERKLEMIPHKTISGLYEHYQNGEMSKTNFYPEIKDLMSKKPVLKDIEAPLTVVERKRIEHIISLLKRHEKLTSSELSDMTGLSRTRCNEYFKIMENLKMIEAAIRGREKYYRLKS